MEQNQDALEYSSEDESKKKGETLSEALGKLKEKGKKDLSKVDHTEIKYPDFRCVNYSSHIVWLYILVSRLFPYFQERFLHRST
jgi:hypothetical protein